MPAYQLHPDRELPFRRTVHLKNGTTRQLVFPVGQAIELSREEVAGVRKEIELGWILPAGAKPPAAPKPEPARLDPLEHDRFDDDEPRTRLRYL